MKRLHRSLFCQKIQSENFRTNFPSTFCKTTSFQSAFFNLFLTLYHFRLPTLAFIAAFPIALVQVCFMKLLEETNVVWEVWEDPTEWIPLSRLPIELTFIPFVKIGSMKYWCYIVKTSQPRRNKLIWKTAFLTEPASWCGRTGDFPKKAT